MKRHEVTEYVWQKPTFLRMLLGCFYRILNVGTLFLRTFPLEVDLEKSEMGGTLAGQSPVSPPHVGQI